MKKIISIPSIILAVALCFSGCIPTRMASSEKTSFFAFDTVINLTVASENAKAVLEECKDEIYRLDKIFNVHSPDSEISFLNAQAVFGPVKVSEELYGLIERSICYSEETYGAFDITIKPLADLWNVNSENPVVPSEADIKDTLSMVSYKNIVLYPDLEIGFSSPDTQIDLGGVAKGYAADRLLDIAKAHSATWALIDLGGNISCVGDRDFSIGIQHPDKSRGEYFRVIDIRDSSVVTSGGYERGFEKDGVYYHHILSPFDGYPSDSGLKSVTVTGNKSEMCDAYSTAVFVYGKELAKRICERNKNISFLIVDKNGKTEQIN